MTTFQDPPLQSRRAARQGERPESSATPFAPPQVPRTAAGAGEPLSYVTQNRPPLPGYDASSGFDSSTVARGRRSSDPLRSSEFVAETPPAAPAAFRPRDFSPEARTAPPAWAPEYDRGGAAQDSAGQTSAGQDSAGQDSAGQDSGVVDYHTQARASVFPGVATSVAASLASDPNEPSEQTLSRRELRAIRDAHGITAVPTEANPIIPQQQTPAQWAQEPAPTATAAPSPIAASTAAPARVASTQLDSAMAEFDALAGRPAGLESRPPATQPRRGGRRASAEVAPEDGIGAFEAFFSQPTPEPLVQQPVQAQPVQAQPAQFAQPVVPQPAQYAQPVVPQHAQPVEAQPIQPQPVQPQPVQPQPGQYAQPIQAQPIQAQPIQAQQPQYVEAAPIATQNTRERPVGHWTNQADLDDQVQAVTSKVSRTVGSGAITTSALVLPSLPGHNMATGEVMLTGSISLPHALAATGALTALDESDIDHLLDPGDHQLVNTGSVPIRAIKAVSSHGSSRTLVNPQKPARGNRALTALIASASVMVLVVVTLLIVALVTEVL